MLRGPKHLRTAQAVTLAVAAIMMVAIVAVALSAHDASDDWGVVWSEPESMIVDSIEPNDRGDALVLRLHLADAKGQATEWGGLMHLQVTDEDLEMAYEREFRVRASDFTTVNRDGVVDTFLEIVLPLDHMSHHTERMLTVTSTDVSVRVTLTFGQQTLTALRHWWTAPEYVKLESTYLDEEEEWILYDVFLLDGDWQTTKSSGDLRVVLYDSLGMEMYNRSEAVSAGDFNTLSWGSTGWAWYRGWVLFEDVRPSSDRIQTDDGEANGSGRWMRMVAEFTSDGVDLSQDRDGPTAVSNTMTIPDALLMENRAPTVRLSTDRFGLTGMEHSFDASGTRDDLGTGGLVYEWSWGDGTLTEVTDGPVAMHTFSRPGSFNVQLTVTDLEGASSTAAVEVDVLQNPRVDPDDVGDGGLLDKVLDSYTAAKLRDLFR